MDMEFSILILIKITIFLIVIFGLVDKKKKNYFLGLNKRVSRIGMIVLLSCSDI